MNTRLSDHFTILIDLLLGDTGRSGYCYESMETLKQCLPSLKKKYPKTEFDSRTILCLLPAIRFAKGGTVSTVSFVVWVMIVLHFVLNGMLLITEKQLMIGYGIFGHFIDALGRCEDVTNVDFPLLFEHKRDMGKKKGAAISKALTGVNHKKIVMFIVRLDYFLHIWNANVRPEHNQEVYAFNFEQFPTLRDLFSDLEKALWEKKYAIAYQLKPIKKEAKKKLEGMDAISKCHTKLKALHKTVDKLLPVLKVQLEEAAHALSDAELAVVNVMEKPIEKWTKTKKKIKKEKVDKIKQIIDLVAGQDDSEDSDGSST